jgi:hypothetical protein
MVKNREEIDKGKELKIILIYTIILICIFIFTNTFFQYDPLNIIEDAILLEKIPS